MERIKIKQSKKIYTEKLILAEKEVDNIDSSIYQLNNRIDNMFTNMFLIP